MFETGRIWGRATAPLKPTNVSFFTWFFTVPKKAFAIYATLPSTVLSQQCCEVCCGS